MQVVTLCWHDRLSPTRTNNYISSTDFMPFMEFHKQGRGNWFQAVRDLPVSFMIEGHLGYQQIYKFTHRSKATYFSRFGILPIKTKQNIQK